MYLETIPVYNYGLAPVSAIKGWSSFIWTERYQEVGEFEIRIPERNPNLLTYLDDYMDKFIKLPYSEETMIIEEITYEGGRDQSAVYIRGRDAKSILQRRVLVATSVIPYSVPTNEILLQVFNDEIASPSELSRQIDLIALDDPSSWSVHHLDYETKGKSVWDMFLYCAQIYKCGLRTYWKNNKIRFQFWKPKVRSGEDNTFPVVFNEELGTLSNIIYRKTSKTYRTSAYVHVEGGQNNSVIINEDVSNRYAKGLNRREMFVDPQWNNQNQLVDNPGVRATLRPYGVSALYEHAFYDNITGEITRNDLYSYGLNGDFYLGDRIAVEVGGRRQYARVKEYTYSWTIDNGFTAYPTIDSTPAADSFL